MLMLCSVTLRAQSTCPSPTNFTASLHNPDWLNVQLSWNPVVDTSAEELTWGTTYSTRIGTNSAADFIGAVRFTPTELSSLSGMKLTSVSFVPGESQAVCTFYVMVWQGGSIVNDTILDPGTLIANKQVTQALTTSTLNTVVLDTALLIDATQELWIGIRCNTTEGYPLGASNNGGIFNYGDLINLGGWQTLSGGDSTASIAAYNWLIVGTFQDPSNIVASYNLYRDNNLIYSSLNTGYLDSVAFGTYQYDLTAEFETGCVSSPVTTIVSMTPNPCIDCLDSIIIGNGTTAQYYLPMNTFYKYSYTQQIFTAAELDSLDGTIPCIAFQYIYTSPQDKDIVVYMGNTDKTQFNSGTDWVPIADMQQVFSGTINFNNAGYDNWVNIPLDAPFEYDGSSNIVVAVLNNTGSYVSSSNNTFNVHSASSKTLYVYTDGAAYTPATSTPSGTVYSNRNNMRFMVGPPVACPTPSHLVVSDVTTDGATLTWHSNDSYAGYELVIVPEGGNFYNETPISVSDTTYLVTNLTENTVYNVYLRANCTPDNSNWKTTEFHTLCNATSTIPYAAHFDNMGSGTAAFPDCWERGLSGSSASYPYISTSYTHSGNGALYFYSYTPNSAVARGQGLDLTDNVDHLVMSVWLYKTSDSYGRMQLGYMTDPFDMSSFVVVKDVYSNDFSTGQWTEFKFPLPETVNGQLIFPTLYCPFAPGSVSNYIYVDDLTIDYGEPECIAATQFEVSDVSYTSAYVSFMPSNNVDYVLVCENAVTGVSNTVTLSGVTNYLLSGLDTMTTYNLKLYPDCSDVPDTLYASFTTHTYEVLSCLTPDTNAQEISVGSTSTSYLLPVNNFYRYTYSQQIFTPAEIGGATVLTGVAFEYNYTTASSVKTNCVVYLAHRSTSTFASTSDWTDIHTAVKVYEGPLNCQNGWNEFDFTTYFSYNGVDNLVLIVLDNSNAYDGSSYVFNVHTKNSSQYVSMYRYNDSSPYDPSNPGSGTRSALRNDIKFLGCSQVQSDMLTCPAPNVIVTGTDSASVSLQWAAGGSESEWLLEYKLASAQTWTSAGVVSNTFTYTVDNLAENSAYDFRMRGLCSSSDSSEWVTVSASTTCGYILVPFVEDFESATSTGSSSMLPCWHRGTNYSTQYPYISASYASSGTKSLYFYGTSSNYSYAATPRFDDSVPMDSLQVNFNMYCTTMGYYIEVGIMSDPADYSTFVPLGSFTPDMTYQWIPGEVNTSSYNGDGHYLAFRIPAWGTSYMYLDDITVNYIAPCSHPTNLVLESVTNESATISWTAGGDETEWEYTYGLADSVDLEMAVTYASTDDEVTLTGLTPNTAYDFYVRAVCSGSEVSYWEMLSFNTDCDALTAVPFSQNFDSSYTHTSNISSGPNNLPNCWSAINAGTTYTAYPYVYYSSSYANSGNYSMRFYTYTSSSYGDQYAVLPIIDTNMLSINGLQLSFDMRCYSTSYPFYVIVGVMNGTNLNTFVPVDTVKIEMGSTAYDHKLVFLNNYAGGGDRIAIMAPHVFTGITSYNAGNIDNLVLDVIPTCPQPLHVNAVDATVNSVTVGWQENGSATTWNIEYGPHGFTLGSGTTVQANTNPYTVTGLSEATNYDFYVQAVCSSTDISPWSPMMTVSTTMTPVGLPYSANFTDTTDAWVIHNGTCINYWARGTVAGSPAIFVTTDGTNPGFNVNNTSMVSAQKLFTVGTEQNITINFDIQVGGESSYDYFKLFLAPPTQEFPAANSVTSSDYGYNSYSTYAYNFYGNNYGTQSSYPYVMNLTNGNTIHVTASMPNPNSNPNANSTALLVLAWKNDGSGGVQPGAIITNLSVGELACATPENLTVTNIGMTSADVSWTAGGTETAWNLQYKEASAANWTTVPVTTTSYQLTNLTALTQYAVRVQADCGAGETSFYTTQSFATASCEASQQCSYTFNMSDSYGDGWNGGFLTVQQNGVTVATVELSNGTSGTQAVNLCDNISTSLVWSPGSFDDEATFTLIGPDGSTVYTSSSMDYYTTYTFTTDCGGAPATCNAPTGLAVNNVTTNSATASWTAGGTETSWNVQYKAASASNWQSATANATSYTMTGLTPGTAYQVRVQANCGAGNTSDWTTAVSFTTNQEQQTCPAPTNLTATIDATSHTTVVLTWQQEANTANEWQVNYRISTESTWSTATATSTTYTLTDLTPNVDYVANVVAHCTNGLNSDESNTVTFHTDDVGIVGYLEKAVSLYPNPATEMISVEVSDANIMITGVEVYNVYGQLINTIVSTENPLRINISGLADGMYYVRVTTDGGVVTKNFVKK